MTPASQACLEPLLLTSSLKGSGGTVGSRRNMSSHSRARRQSARLSTSRAMGPTESCTAGQGGREAVGLDWGEDRATAQEWASDKDAGGQTYSGMGEMGRAACVGRRRSGQYALLQAPKDTDLTCYLSIDAALHTTLAGGETGIIGNRKRPPSSTPEHPQGSSELEPGTPPSKTPGSEFLGHREARSSYRPSGFPSRHT